MTAARNLFVAACLVAGAGCAGMNEPPQTTPTPPADTSTVQASERGVIPAGQQLDVRLQERLSSETTQLEERFEATTIVDLTQDGVVLVPAGSVVEGIVANVDRADRLDRKGSLTLRFERLEVRNRTHTIRGMATRVFESGGVLQEEKVGVAGVAGAILGGVIGGLEGAIIGAAIGAGGVIAATEGEDIVLPVGSIVRVRLDAPVRVGVAGS